MQETIQKFYIGFYGRPADPGGLEYWSKQAEEKGWNQVREAFADSAEARDTVYQDPETGQPLQEEEIIQNIYMNLFGRQPEEQGLKFYLERLESGYASQAEIVQQIMDGAQDEDLMVLENKLEVADLFTSSLENEVYHGDSGITAGREALEGRITDEDLTQFKIQAAQKVQDLNTGTGEATFPSDYEQYMLTLINQAREDPEAEAERLGVDLDAGIEGEISPKPKQPLAFNPELTQAARGHSEWMLQEQTFDHTGAGGSDPGERMQEAGYEFQKPWAWGENLAWKGSQDVLQDYSEFIQEQHDNLFHSPGHRENILREEFREAGSGIKLDDYQDYYGPMTSINFARSGEDLFLTGTVYEDLDGSGSYTPGEGLGEVLVQAGDQFTTTWDAGGYALQVPSGNHQVFFSTEDWSLEQDLHIQDQNVQLDVVQDKNTGEREIEVFNPAEDEVKLLGARDQEGGEDYEVLTV